MRGKINDGKTKVPGRKGIRNVEGKIHWGKIFKIDFKKFKIGSEKGIWTGCYLQLNHTKSSYFSLSGLFLAI